MCSAHHFVWFGCTIEFRNRRTLPEAAMPWTYVGEEEMLVVLETLALSEEAMFVIDDRRRIVFWNPEMRRLLGYSHDEVAGRSCCSALAGTDGFGNRYCGEGCPVLSIALRGETVRPYRLSYRAKSGGFVPLEVSIVRFKLRKSKRVLLAHIVREVEEVRMAPQEAPRLAAEPHADARVRELTAREIDVLARLARGQSAATIAGELSISPLTTRNHIHHVFEKLDVHSRSEAVAFAYRMNIV
jgi:PAS domain S-box-containing protein